MSYKVKLLFLSMHAVAIKQLFLVYKDLNLTQTFIFVGIISKPIAQWTD